MEVESSSDRVAEPGPENWFTGEVWLERIVEASRPGRLRAHRVTFAPSARTAWHSHPLGQALEILSGVALVGLADGPGRRLAAGDRVWFEPGERHWHGATPDSVMSHLALQEAGEDGVEAEWGTMSPTPTTSRRLSVPDGRGGPDRRELLLAGLSGSPAVERVRIDRIELAPGQAAGRHRHPCDVVGQVLEGTIRFQIEGEEKRLLEAGEAFHEPRGATIVCFDNASAVRPAVFSAFYLQPPGDDRLIEML